MRDKIFIGILSMVAGAMLMSLAPVQAHHNDYSLKQRVKRLENKMASVEYITFNCTFVTGMSQYWGYLYEDDLGDIWLETAMDYDTTNYPDDWVMVADPSCVDTSSRQGVMKQFPDSGLGEPKTRKHP